MTEFALSPTRPTRGDAPRARSALDQGRHALHVRGSLREARGHFDLAYREAERTGDAETLAQAAVGLGGLWVHEHRDAAEAALVRRRLRRALASVPPGSAAHLQVRLRMAAEDDYAASRHDRILGLLPTARRLGDPHTLATALSLAHHCLLAPEHTDLRRALAEEMLDAATVSDLPGDLLMALLWRTVDRFLEGDPHAERSLTELRGRLERHPHLAVEFGAQALQVMLLIRAGRLDEAEALAADCARVGSTAGDLDADVWSAAHLIAVRWFQGRIGELVPLLAEQVHSPTLSVVDSATFGALAVAAASTGDRARATLALSRLGGGDLARLPRSSSWGAALYGAVEAAHLLGDAEVAGRAYGLLLPCAERPVMVSLAVACFGSTHQALGTAAFTMGRRELAERHLREAVRQNLVLGHWPAVLRSRFRLGQVLAAADRADARQEGVREQGRALAEAARCGWRLPTDGDPTVRVRSAAPVAVTVGTDGPRRSVVVLRRRGRRWTVEWQGRSATVDHSVGMIYLSLLLAHPGQEISCAELAAGQAHHPQARGDGVVSAAQQVVDRHARDGYRRRLAQLERDLDGTGDPERLRQLREEHAWISAELGSGTGLAGRPRTFTGNAERARIAVGKALRRSLDRIAAADRVLGEELRASIQTGSSCCFRPEATARFDVRS